VLYVRDWATLVAHIKGLWAGLSGASKGQAA